MSADIEALSCSTCKDHTRHQRTSRPVQTYEEEWAEFDNRVDEEPGAFGVYSRALFKAPPVKFGMNNVRKLWAAVDPEGRKRDVGKAYWTCDVCGTSSLRGPVA